MLQQVIAATVAAERCGCAASRRASCDGWGAAPGRGVAWRARPGELTVRERDIAPLVAVGRSNKQVAASLHLGEKTVRNTLTRVHAQLDVRSRTQLVSTLR